MLRVLSLLALGAIAYAACPNQCSGHGWCDENDRCVCFRAPGTANQHFAFSGADCSQRVCPYGRAHDVISDQKQELAAIWSEGTNPNVGFLPADPTSTHALNAFLNGGFLLKRDLGLDVRVVSVAADGQSVKFQWKLSNQKTFGAEVTAQTGLYDSRASAYSIHGDGKDSGLYIYFNLNDADIKINPNDRYFLNVTNNNGVSFYNSDPNTAHQVSECSGRGVCDRIAGVCKCADGYSGDACQRTVCPRDCSGHGICQSQKYFVSDAYINSSDPKAYDLAYDAESNFGCKCDTGFRGPDCSQRECPSGPDPMRGNGGAEGLDCSSRGLCDYSTGLCKCFKGFFGERCEEQSTLI